MAGRKGYIEENGGYTRGKEDLFEKRIWWVEKGVQEIKWGYSRVKRIHWRN